MKKIVILMFFIFLLNQDIENIHADGIDCVPIKVFHIKNFEIKVTKKDNCGFGMTQEIIEKQRKKQEEELKRYIIN